MSPPETDPSRSTGAHEVDVSFAIPCARYFYLWFCDLTGIRTRESLLSALREDHRKSARARSLGGEDSGRGRQSLCYDSMEQFSAAEGAVAHIDPGVDEIDSPIPSLVVADPAEPPRSAPPSHDPSASDGFTSVKPELEAGRIAAMKRKLSDQGLDIEAAKAAVMAPQEGAGAAAAGVHSATMNAKSKNGGISAQPAATESSPSSISAASDVQAEERMASAGRILTLEASQSGDSAMSSRGSWQGPSHNPEADFEEGKIVSIKKELVAKGLHIDPAVAAALAAAGVTTARGNDSDGGLDAAIAAEFEKGKIAAMKERLVSEGLDIHAAAAAAAAAMAKDASELADDLEEVNIAEAGPGMAAADGVEEAPSGAGMETNRANDTLSETTGPEEVTSAHAPGEPVEVGEAADAKVNAGPDVVIPAEGELEGELEGDRTAGVPQGADASARTGMNGGEEATAAAASAAMACEEGGGAPASAPPHEAISGDSNHIDHLLPPEPWAYGAEESSAVPPAEGGAQNESNANGRATSADAGANGQAPAAVRAASSSTASVPGTESAEMNGEGTRGASSGARTAGTTTKSKVRAAPSEDATSRAKAQPRQPSTSPSRNPTTSDRKPARKPSSAPRTAAPSRRGSASPIPDRKRSSGTAGSRSVARSSTSPAGVRRGTAPQQSSSRQVARPPQQPSRVAPQSSEPTGQPASEASQHPAVVSPQPAAPAQQPSRPARQPSRSPSQQPSHPSQARVAASLAEARSRRLAGSPAVSSGGDARRRADASSITPSGGRSRSLHSTPDEQRGTHGAARTSQTTPGATTPSPSGPRVAGRGRAVERQVRSRYSPVIGASQGASPAATPSQESTVTPVRAVHGGGSSSIVMTPYSAEQSGRRLHDRARQSRERLERRRREEATPGAPEGLSPFMPRRLANPNMGNPSVSGMDRVERLYRDASQRESKLEAVRRMEDENPPDCTFTPKISARAASRGRSPRRGSRSGGEDSDRDAPGGEGGGDRRGRSLTCFHDLYRDAENRRAKLEAMTNQRRVEVAGPGSPVITARGRSRSREPLEVRLKENSERWARRWKELEERKVVQDREGCTFQPQFKAGRSASAPRMRTRGRENGGGDSEQGAGGEPFYLRVRKYIAAREGRLEQLKRDVESKQRAEATFQPNVSIGLRGDGEADDALASAERAGHGLRRRKNSGGSDGVFERLARAAAEQESNRAALKEAYLQEERERFHGFQVRFSRVSTRAHDGEARCCLC